MITHYGIKLILSISDRLLTSVILLRAKRSEAKRARKRALSHVVVDEFHLQNLKTAITQKLSILEVWCMEQNVFSCTCFTHI